MNLHSRSVAAPSGFRQTSRIALGKRARLDEALKCQIFGRSNCLAGRALKAISPRASARFSVSGHHELPGFVICGPGPASPGGSPAPVSSGATVRRLLLEPEGARRMHRPTRRLCAWPSGP